MIWILRILHQIEQGVKINYIIWGILWRKKILDKVLGLHRLYYIGSYMKNKIAYHRGGQTRDIPNVYSDSTCKKIDHNSFYIQRIYMR